jgi:hypothetical protein
MRARVGALLVGALFFIIGLSAWAAEAPKTEVYDITLIDALTRDANAEHGAALLLEARRTDGKSAMDAIYDACLVRFRPIMMTTMAALVATLPIALGWGAGAESRRPLGGAVVGGLLVSQTLTLYLTPAFYTYMEQLNEWLSQRTVSVSFDRLENEPEGAVLRGKGA